MPPKTATIGTQTKKPKKKIKLTEKGEKIRQEILERKKKKEEEKNTEVKYSVGDKITFSLPSDKSIKVDGEVERVNKNSYTISFEATPEIKKAMGSTGYRKFKRDGKNILMKTYTAKQLER